MWGLPQFSMSCPSSRRAGRSRRRGTSGTPRGCGRIGAPRRLQPSPPPQRANATIEGTNVKIRWAFADIFDILTLLRRGRRKLRHCVLNFGATAAKPRRDHRKPRRGRRKLRHCVHNFGATAAKPRRDRLKFGAAAAKKANPPETSEFASCKNGRVDWI